MNPDPDSTKTPGVRLEDELLGALVRGVAEEWRMPPQRLDLPTWRERARSDGARRRSRLARLAVPAATGLVATLVLALSAVWLTAPRGDRAIAGSSPATTSAPSLTAGPVGTVLPELSLNGDLPSVTKVMVRAGGQYRVADLGSGTLGVSAINSFSSVYQTTLVQRPSGGWLCLCVDWTSIGPNGPTGISLSVVAIDASGNAGQPQEVRRVNGTPDPNVQNDIQFQIADANVSVAPDDKTAFFSWTARNGDAGWRSGVDVVDVATGALLGSTPMPAEQPSGTQGQPVSRNAPTVKLSPAGDQVLISSYWYVEEPNNPNPTSGTDHWTSPFVGQAIGQITALPSTSSADCSEFDSGLIDSTSYYLVCAAHSGDLIVRRVGMDGTTIAETTAPRTDAEFAVGSLVARSGDGLYVWDPAAAVLARIDLGTGALKVSSSPSASDGGGPLDALAVLGRRVGRWIAPSVVAKSLLQPGIVVSPDGTRVYGIGVSSPAATDRGSTGVFAFDAASLARLGQWAPTADFSSVAVSADGRFVYAGAQGGIDATGGSSGNGASVTVFDASNGSVRLIAGRLGSSDLSFADSTLR